MRFNAAEAILWPLLRTYGPSGTELRVSYPYDRFVRDRLWCLPDYAEVVRPKGNVREQLARQCDAPAGFAPDVLATFERAPELIARACGGACSRWQRLEM